MNFVNTSSYMCYISFYSISFMSSISSLYHKIQMKKACLWRNFWSTFLWDSMTTVWKWTMWVLCLPVATHYTSMQRRSSQYKICLLIVVFLEFMDYIVNPQCMHFRHSCKNCCHCHLPQSAHWAFDSNGDFILTEGRQLCLGAMPYTFLWLPFDSSSLAN